MNLDLDAKLVLVTGSTSGIGRATARQYLEEGAAVIVTGLTEDETRSTVDDLSTSGTVHGIAADLTTAEGVAALIAFVDAIGPLDILVNNAGVFSVKVFSDLTDDDWQTYLDMNVMSAVRLSRHFLAKMLVRGEGAIINIASEAGVKPLPQMVHYSVSKTALIGLTRGLAELTKGTRVRVNSILPGPTWTEGVEHYFEGLCRSDPRPMAEIVAAYFQKEEPTSLIQRFVKPDEVARLIVFTSANESMNGAAYRVEGGIIRSIL